MKFRLPSLLFLIALVSGLLFGQESYDQVRIWSDNTAVTVLELQSYGIDSEGINVRRAV